MIRLSECLNDCQRALKIMNPGDSIHVRTYKGDRGFTVIRQEDGFIFQEDGYLFKDEAFSEERALLKEIKRAMRREFPRSNKLHFERRS